MQGGDELIDQGGALFNQGHLVAAQQPQLLQHGILLAERPPVRPIQAQRVGKAPGIQVVALGAALGPLRSR